MIFFVTRRNVREKLHQWQPRHQKNRIIAQQSIFLFLEMNPENKCSVVSKVVRKGFGSQKRIVWYCSESMLFPDFDGFARQRNQDVPYTRLTASQYKENGEMHSQRGD